MTVELVIFDCDGVLVDSESIANRVWVELLREHGLEFTPREFLKRSVGTTLIQLYEGLQVDYGWERPSVFDAELDARLAAAFQDVQAIEGVTDLLRALTVPACVASNSRADRLHLKLRVAGLADVFAGRVFDASMVVHGKPEPDLFLHAAGSLGVAPDRCLVIEDSLLGTMAGVRAGMTVWGFTGGAHALPDLAEELRQVGAARVFSSMRELAAQLNGVVAVS